MNIKQLYKHIKIKNIIFVQTMLNMFINYVSVIPKKTMRNSVSQGRIIIHFGYVTGSEACLEKINPAKSRRLLQEEQITYLMEGPNTRGTFCTIHHMATSRAQGIILTWLEKDIKITARNTTFCGRNITSKYIFRIRQYEF